MTESGPMFGPFKVQVEEGQLRLLAKATGDTSERYVSINTSQQAVRRLLGPPTLPFCLGMANDVFFEFLASSKIDATRALHAEQSFTYHGAIHAGQELHGTLRLLGSVTRKQGALRFFEIERVFRDASNGALVSEEIVTLVVPEQRSTPP